MRFYTFKKSAQAAEEIGVMLKAGGKLYSMRELGYDYDSMNAFICADPNLDQVRARVEKCVIEGLDPMRVTLCAPIPRPLQDVLCLGLNYAAHAAEAAAYKAKSFSRDSRKTVYFSKRVNRAVADGENIPSHSDIESNLDYEAELGVVLKKDAFMVSEADAWDYIFGYTVINDISARNLQSDHKQWYFGKSLDGFLPMGPCIVTEDEFERPPCLHISCHVNDEERQSSNTQMHLTGIDTVISELSAGMTLMAGTIIAMGTPAGVGMGMNPPRFLHPGDIVRCEIENIGVITNTVSQ